MTWRTVGEAASDLVVPLLAVLVVYLKGNTADIALCVGCIAYVEFRMSRRAHATTIRELERRIDHLEMKRDR